MILTYKHLSSIDKKEIEDSLIEKPIDYASFIPMWEASHYAHSIYIKTATGDELKEYQKNMLELEKAISDAEKTIPAK